MHNQSNEAILRSILWKTINIHENFTETYQLFVLPKEDYDFVKAQLEKPDESDELQLDSFAKLFIAFYFESIPSQIIANLKNFPIGSKGLDQTREYLLAIAGLLHEVKVAITELSEILLPYLTAYQEFISGEESGSNEDNLLTEFTVNVENAIQAVIKF